MPAKTYASWGTSTRRAPSSSAVPPVDRPAGHPHLAAAGREHSRDEAGERRLPDAARPDDGDVLAGGDAQVEGVEDGLRAHAVGQGDRPELHRGGRSAGGGDPRARGPGGPRRARGAGPGRRGCAAVLRGDGRAVVPRRNGVGRRGAPGRVRGLLRCGAGDPVHDDQQPGPRRAERGHQRVHGGQQGLDEIGEGPQQRTGRHAPLAQPGHGHQQRQDGQVARDTERRRAHRRPAGQDPRRRGGAGDQFRGTPLHLGPGSAGREVAQRRPCAGRVVAQRLVGRQGPPLGPRPWAAAWPGTGPDPRAGAAGPPRAGPGAATAAPAGLRRR
ncbi:hypothetical protein SGRIM128S_01274 [Streptomyces griseomycini]